MERVVISFLQQQWHSEFFDLDNKLVDEYSVILFEAGMIAEPALTLWAMKNHIECLVLSSIRSQKQ